MALTTGAVDFHWAGGDSLSSLSSLLSFSDVFSHVSSVFLSGALGSLWGSGHGAILEAYRHPHFTLPKTKRIARIFSHTLS